MTVVSTPKLYLYFDIPTPIFKARVNMPSPTYPANSIDFDGVTLGVYTDIEFDMTLLLGTADGLDDLGRVRVKLAEVDNIRISRSSKGFEDGTLVLTDNAYITVLDDFRVWSKLPYFSLDSEGDVIQGQDFKDGNISPGTYNTLIPPKANPGPWMAGLIDSVTNLMEVEFPGGGVNTSFALADGATITGYAWDIRDGTLTFGTLTSAVIRATFPAGKRWVKLTVTDSNGLTHTCRCFVVAIDPANDITIKNYGIKQNLEIGSSTLDIELYRDTPRTTYPDGTLVMFWWGNIQDASDRSHIKFCGWIDNENFSTVRQKTGLRKTTTIHCVDIAGRMAALTGFPQALDRTTSDSLWSVMPSLDMHKALWYVGFWHSTAFNLADFIMPSGLRSYDCMILYFSGASMFDQMNAQAQKIVPKHLFTNNTQGQLSIIRDWMLDDLSDRPEADPVISDDEWNDLSATYNRSPKVYSLKTGAVLVSTAYIVVDDEDTVPLVFSVAPGESSAFGQGSQEMQDNEGLTLSQIDLNRASGHLYARVNSRYGEFKFTDPTGYNFWNCEPAMVKRVQVEIAASLAAQRGLDFTAFAGQVKSIQVEYNSTKMGTSIRPSLSIEKEVSGYPATTHIPEGQGDVVETTIPSPTSNAGLMGDPQLVAGMDNDGYIFRTYNFQDATPVWDKVTPVGINLSASYKSFVVDPFSPGYRGVPGGDINAFVIGSGSVLVDAVIWKITDLFGTPVATALHTCANGMQSPGTYTIQASFGRFQSAEEENPWIMAVAVKNDVSGSLQPNDGVWEVHSTDGGATWSTEQKITSSSPAGSGSESTQYPCIWLSPRTPGYAITFAYETSTHVSGYKTTDWGAAWANMTDPDIDNVEGFGGSIHVPYQDNEDESLVYHGWFDRAAPSLWKTKKVDGVTITDISPTHSGALHGPMYGSFGLRAHDSDRQRMAMWTATSLLTSAVAGEYVMWTSTNGGTSWTSRIVITDTNDVLTYGAQVAFDGEDLDTLYIFGVSPATSYCIALSTDMGATIQDKKGNLFTDFYGGGTFGGFIGIAGGPLT